ncbi:MAG: bacillithiol system redox-active protein YtxJ [Acidobacteria bacterium]|nr:MAG: bacillithiol system redox-active protein YtxJ [Acidobacteriota bacterium]
MSQASPQESSFVVVNDRAALDALIARSHREPVILFKHSLTCPISAYAYRQLKQMGAEVALVVVQQARDVSRAVETVTGIRHESPQAIILRNGQPAWSASHYEITAAAVTQAARVNE